MKVPTTTMMLKSWHGNAIRNINPLWEQSTGDPWTTNKDPVMWIFNDFERAFVIPVELLACDVRHRDVNVTSQ